MDVSEKLFIKRENIKRKKKKGGGREGVRGRKLRYLRLEIV